MRQLASIQRIDNLEPIPGADAIEVASILGWKVVVRKGEFNVGDLCVYCEIDSILPEKPEFEFLRERHFRIKTIKLRKQVSQGIAFPLSILFQADVTDALGITKHEPVGNFAQGQSRGNFPGFLCKTDETRIQSIPHVLDIFKGKRYFITQKLDGTSATYFYDPAYGYGVCSRNFLKDEGDNVYWQMGLKYDIENKLKEASYRLSIGIAIQGEIVGPGIQGNRLKLDSHELRVFNVFNVDNYSYFGGPVDTFCATVGLTPVPLLETGDSFDYTLEQLIEKAKGKYASGQNQEGIVIRLFDEAIQCRGTCEGRPSFKVINNEFLLEPDEN